MNGGILNNARRNTSRIFSKKKKYLKDKINHHEIDSNNKNFNDFCSGVNRRKKEYNLH
jgi:hypothetical protein